MTIISYDVNGDLKKVNWIKDYLTFVLLITIGRNQWFWQTSKVTKDDEVMQVCLCAFIFFFRIENFNTKFTHNNVLKNLYQSKFKTMLINDMKVSEAASGHRGA